MVANLHGSPRRGSGGFPRVADEFLASTSKGPPFADILSAERIERVFARYRGLFGLYGIYTVAVTVWPFLSQVLRDGKEASCQAAVARVVSHCQQVGIAAPTSDPGDYRTRQARLSWTGDCDLANPSDNSRTGASQHYLAYHTRELCGTSIRQLRLARRC